MIRFAVAFVLLCACFACSPIVLRAGTVCVRRPANVYVCVDRAYRLCYLRLGDSLALLPQDRCDRLLEIEDLEALR